MAGVINKTTTQCRRTESASERKRQGEFPMTPSFYLQDLNFISISQTHTLYLRKKCPTTLGIALTDLFFYKNK